MVASKRSIDVIVPIYKVEPYLPKCIESLLHQDYENYTITLVDDGSPDNCPRICDYYAEKYPDRIRVIHKENGGLSDARNTGVRCSQADFIAFVDSDDYVSERYLSSMYEALERSGADMSIAPVRKEFLRPDGSTYVITPPLGKFTVLDRCAALEELCFEKHFSSYAVSKLIPRENALAHPFPVGKYFEDSFTIYRQIMTCRSVVYVPEPSYFYLQREGSIQRHHFEQKHLDLVYAAQEMMAVFSENKMPDSVMTAAAYKVCRACYITLFHAADLKWPEYKNIHNIAKGIYSLHLSTAVSHKQTSLKEKILFCLMGMSKWLFYVVVRAFSSGRAKG